MCHLLLLLPLAALPVFWWLPVSLSVPIYGAVVAVSGGAYWLALRAMHRPVETGAEALLNSTGEVIDPRPARLRIRVHGEIWNAKSRDNLRKGQRVKVLKVDGLTLTVCRIDRPTSRVLAPAPGSQ